MIISSLFTPIKYVVYQTLFYFIITLPFFYFFKKKIWLYFSVFLNAVVLLVLAAPFFAALIWHLMVWPVTFRVGRSATGLLLVSAATLLGGCGILSMHQLLQPLSLYYTGCLGGGMLVLYVLLRSCLTYSKGYDLHRRFAAIFCVLGVCMACLVMLDYAARWQEFLQVHTTLYLKYRNFATALLLTTLPMSFYLSLKKPAHLLGMAVQAAGLALTGSRSAL